MSDENSAPGFWSCARNAPIGEIARALELSDTFRVEISARDWTDDVRMMEAVARALSFPDYFGYNIHALIDCLGEFAFDRPRFLLVIRDIPGDDEVRGNVRTFADTLGRECHDRRRQCVVLEGWPAPTLEFFDGRDRRAWPVRPLQTASEPQVRLTPWRPGTFGFWSCPKDAPLGHLSRALGVPEPFCIELSAHDWDDEGRVFDELARAFSFPEVWGRNWDAASDCLSDVHDLRPRFLAVIRDIPASEAARANVETAAATIGAADREERAQCVVLDGWSGDEIVIGRGPRAEKFPVWPLKTS